MFGSMLAHAGGLDEMAIVLFPILVGGGVWVLTRDRKSQAVKPKAPPPSSSTQPKSKRQTWN